MMFWCLRGINGLGEGVCLLVVIEKVDFEFWSRKIGGLLNKDIGIFVLELEIIYD